MGASEILEGLKGIVSPIISFAEDIISFFFSLPPIAGISIGVWILLFAVLGIIFGGFFS